MRGPLRTFFAGNASEDGQAIIVIAITMLAMLMMVGIAIDAGQLYSARRAMKEAADAAAYAGTVTLYQGGTQTQAFAAATTDATTNGYTNGVNGVTLTVSQPTTSPYNTAAFVQVTITQNVRTALVPAEAGLTTVSVTSISGAESMNNNFAIMALDRNSTASAFQSGATASITLNGGGVLINSTSTTAGNSSTPAANWSITCPSTNPCNINIAGGSTGTWPAAHPASPNYFNGVYTSQPQQTDPFAGYPKPSTSGLQIDRLGFGTGNLTLGTGVYDYDITGKNFCHGVYILKGGGMSGNIGVDTTSTDPLTGTLCDGKVFIFNTMSTYPAIGGTCTGVTVSGNKNITLYAMTSGTYAGLLFYQDSACTGAMSFGGTAFNLTSTGTIYLPNAAFTANGSPTIAGGQIVAKSVNLANASVNITFNAATSAQPILPRLAQ